MIQKFSPLMTDDYKKAYLKAVTSKVFASNSKDNSKITQRTIEYFVNNGITNKQLIMSVICNDVFMTQIKGLSEHEQQEAIEIEVKNQTENILNEKEETIKALENVLIEKENNVSKTLENKDIELNQTINKYDLQISELEKNVTALQEENTKKDQQSKKDKWENKKEKFVEEEWGKTKSKFINAISFIIFLLLAQLGLNFTKLKDYITLLNKLPQISNPIILNTLGLCIIVCIVLAGLYAKGYDWEHVKKMFLFLFYRDYLESNCKKEYEEEYVKKNPFQD